MADSKLAYHGTTLVRFGDATEVTLGCNCGGDVDCDCLYRNDGHIEIQ